MKSQEVGSDVGEMAHMRIEQWQKGEQCALSMAVTAAAACAYKTYQWPAACPVTTSGVRCIVLASAR